MAEIHTPWAWLQHEAGSHSCTNTRHVPMGPNSPHSHFSHVCVVIFPLILQEKGKSTLKQALLFVMAYFKRDFPAWRSLKPCSQHRSPPMCFFSCIQRVLQSSRTSWMAVPALQGPECPCWLLLWTPMRTVLGSQLLQEAHSAS